MESRLSVVGSAPPSSFSNHKYELDLTKTIDNLDLSLYRTQSPSQINTDRNTNSRLEIKNKPKKQTKKNSIYKFPYGSAAQNESIGRNSKSRSSYVDETLFGSTYLAEANFPAPWENKHYKKESVANRYYYSALPHTLNNNAVTSREHSVVEKRNRSNYLHNGSISKGTQCSRSSNHCSTSQQNRPQSSRQMFKDSFVDESLFGQPPEDAQFDAPWGERVHTRSRPLIFDGVSSYKTNNATSSQSTVPKACQVSVSIRKSLPSKPRPVKQAWR